MREALALALALPRHNAAFSALSEDQMADWEARCGQDYTTSALSEVASSWGLRQDGTPMNQGVEFDDTRERYKNAKTRKWAEQILARRLANGLNSGG